MKNISLILMILIGAVVTSCTFTEKISFEEDGSGSFEMNMDMSGAMSFTKGMADGMSSDDSTETTSTKVPEMMDSTISFNDLLMSIDENETENIEQKKAVLESLKDAKMKMLVDEANGKMLMDFLYDFNDISDLKNIQQKVSNAYSVANKKEADLSTTPSSTVYQYSNTSFKRLTVQNKMSKKERKEYDETMQQMQMFFAGSFYKLEYSFPNKIKKTTAKNATFSEDKKTMYISYPFEEIMKNQEALDFEVKF